MVKKLQL